VSGTWAAAAAGASELQTQQASKEGHMDQEELRRALQTRAGIRCSDEALLAQLATAADTQGLASRDLASKLNAWLINE